jgi:hypothetical protein
MKTQKTLAVLGALGFLVAAGAATAAGPGPGGGTNYYSHTNYYAYSNYYQNHYLYTNGTGEGWYTNMARWSNAPVPQQFKNRHGVVAPTPGPRVEPPGPRPGGPLTPADVQALVRRFQQDREAFMIRQRSLEQQMSSAAEQDRVRLRDQLKEQMEQWKQQQARLREQLQDQCDRLGDQLRDHTRLMDRVSNPGTPPGGAGAQNGAGVRGREER